MKTSFCFCIVFTLDAVVVFTTQGHAVSCTIAGVFAHIILLVFFVPLQIVFCQFVNWLVDIPFIFIGFFVMCTVYRGIVLLRDVCPFCVDSPDPYKRARNACERRLAVLHQVFLFALDIATLFVFVPVICTMYMLCSLGACVEHSWKRDRAFFCRYQVCNRS